VVFISEFINNREYRQKVLKELLMELHSGKTVDEVKPRFQELIKDVSTHEITQMEQSLIMEGMPPEEIQRLCDVHPRYSRDQSRISISLRSRRRHRAIPCTPSSLKTRSSGSLLTKGSSLMQKASEG
jgi:hypothetical protein